MSSKISRVTVLKGGPSAERDVSLSSAVQIEHALRAAGYKVASIDAGPDLVDALRASNPDVVFNALHGRWGEDGCIQGVLEWLQIPYTHSGVYAPALAMDKERSKAIYRTQGLPVVESLIADRSEVADQHLMKPPYVIKPYNEGSSVGIYIVEAGAERPPELASDMPDQLMVEAYVPGRELTVAVLNDKALTVTDIVSEGWYDYDAKYKDGGSHHVVPAKLPQEIFDACMDYAERAHRALGCRYFSRTDFRWDEARGLDGLILLETNTQPGMTPTSLAPEQAAYLGIDFSQLCTQLVEDASCNR